MRQQFVNAAVGLRRQSGEDVLEVSPRIVSIELCRHHEAHDDGGEAASGVSSVRLRLTEDAPRRFCGERGQDAMFVMCHWKRLGGRPDRLRQR